MSNNNLNFWIDVSSNTLMSGWQTTAQAQQPLVMQGDGLSIDIHMIDNSSGLSVEIPFPANCSLKCAIGSIDRYPTSGYFTFNYGTDSVIIPISSTIASVNSLINALPSITAAGGVIVSFVNSTTYRLVFNTVGSKLDASINSTTLYPKSISSTRTIIEGTSSVNEIQHLKIRTAPVAYADTFSLKAQPTVIVQELTSSIFRIKLSESPRLGNFTISNGTKTTAAISFNASAADVGASMIQAGLSVSSNVAGTRYYVVNKPDDNTFDISRTMGAYEALTVTPIGITGFSTMVGELNVNSYEIEDLLAGSSSVNAIIEIELTSGNTIQTIYQGSIKISNDLIDDAIYEPTVLPTAFEDAPHDGILYGRKDGGWSAVVGDGNNIPDYDNGIVYTIGNQVYYQGKLYRMQIASGVAGDDPVSSPNLWESLSGGNSGLNSSGITMDINATIALSTSSSDSVFITGSSIGINSPAAVNQTFLTPDSVTVSAPTGSLVVGATGITFPDLTIQTTAAVTPDLSAYATQSFVTSQGYITSSSLSGYATETWVGLQGFLTSSSINGYATESWVTSQGYITSSALIPYAPLASPAFSGVPTSPTPLASDNSTTIATTAYVTNAVASSTTSPSTQKVTKTVRNATSALIPKRSVVYINGANGNNATIALAQANSESTSYRTFGITESDIAINEDGVVVIIGEVLNVNTGSFNDGDQLYLSPTIAGGITNVKPSAPDHMVYVGVVTRANNNNGKIEVNIANGLELHELHDVAIATKVNNQLVAYESSTNLWKNKSAATLGIAELSGATFTGKVTSNPIDLNTPSFNLGATAINTSPTNAVNGDIWITNAAAPKLAYKTGGVSYYPTVANAFNTFSAGIAIIGASASNPQLQVTQSGAGTAVRITTTGAGNALIVEDEASPDAHSFIVNTGGNVGIGVASGYTPVGKLDVNGLITSNTASAGTASTVVATTAFVKTAAVSTVIPTLETNYVVTNLLGWNTVIRILSSSNTTIQVNADNVSNLGIGTKIMFLHESSSVVTFIPVGCSIVSLNSMMSISGYGGVATLMKINSNQWVIYGDLAHPTAGTLLSSGCVQSEAADFVGTMFTGYFVHQEVTADGNGGTVINNYPNSNGCWYPNGWVIDHVITSQNSLSWYAYDNTGAFLTNGSFAYYTEYGTTFADGSGGTYGTGSNTSANAGDVIYGGSYWDSAGQQYINYSIVYDGNQGYYQI